MLGTLVVHLIWLALFSSRNLMYMHWVGEMAKGGKAWQEWDQTASSRIDHDDAAGFTLYWA